MMKTNTNKINKTMSTGKLKEIAREKLKPYLNQVTPSKTKKSINKDSTRQTSKSLLKSVEKKTPSTPVKTSKNTPISSKKKLKISPKVQLVQKGSQAKNQQRQKLHDDYLRYKAATDRQKASLMLQSNYSFNPNVVEVESQFQNSQPNAIKNMAVSIFSTQSKLINSYPTPNVVYQLDMQQKAQQQQSIEEIKRNAELVERRNRQEYQILKLKNEQLNNYIEELEKNEADLIRQNTEKCLKITEEYQRQKNDLITEIQSLQFLKKNKETLAKEINQMKKMNERVLTDNANLQEMFNQSKKNELKLQKQLSEQKLHISTLIQQREVSDRKYKQCSEEKKLIKQQAEQILNELRQFRQYQSEQI